MKCRMCLTRKAEMSHQDTSEKYKCDSQRYPEILILPKSTPTDITNAYKHTIWATEAGSHNKL